MDVYSSEFYKEMKEGARLSATVVVPLVLEFAHPGSVIDVGSGVGAWLSIFREHGVQNIWGVDGDYVDRSLLEIPEERFITHDLTEPLHLGRRFDLVLGLEVAEHLPAECAGIFVDTLTGLGSLVLFSAAIPYQGGTNHVNEQWPEYWAELFEHRGYVPIDCLRRKIWSDERVSWWYAQNLLLFCERTRLDEHPALKREFELMGTEQLSLVHPQKYLYCIEWGMSLQSSANHQSDG